jgi:flagellin
MVRTMKTASLTQGMKNALTSLGDLQDQITTTNQRLATGKKVNSALDNALNFFIADSFSSKARGLSTILDNIGLGLNVLRQTDKALGSIRASLDQAEGTLRAALNSAGTNSKITTAFAFRDITTNTASVNALLTEGAAGTTQNRLQAGDTVQVSLVRITTTGSATVVSTGTVFTSTAVSTVNDLINNITATTGGLNVAGQAPRVSAYLNDAGNLVIESSLVGQAIATSSDVWGLQINVATAGGTGVQNNTLDIFQFSGAVGANPNLTSGTATTQVVNIVGSSTNQQTRASAALSFREVLNQIRNSSLDAGYNGTNLLQGDFLRVGFNEEETTSLITRGQRIDSGSLGFVTDVTAANVGDALYNFQSDREISNGLKKIRTAKEIVNSLNAQFASNANLLTNRQDYTKFAVKNFNDGADLLTLADINEEGANLSSLQTRQQLAVTSLSLANQSDQAILRLF